MKKIYFILIFIIILFFAYYFWQNQLSKNQEIIRPLRKNFFQEKVNRNQKRENENSPISGFFLEVVNPKNGIVVNSPLITVSGKTAPLAEVYVNDQLTKADSQGNFSLSINLDEGENLLLVSANDEQGNFETKELLVTLETLE